MGETPSPGCGTRAWTARPRLLADTTLRSAVRGGGWATGGTFVGRVANVGALLFAARLLGSEQFGGMSLALATVGVVTSVSSLGLPVAAQKLVAESRGMDPARQDRLINTTIGITVVAGIAALLGFLVSGDWVAGALLGRANLTPVLAVATVLVLSTPCAEVIAALLAALERFKELGAYRAVYGGLSGGLLVGTLLVLPNATAALSAVAVAEGITCAVGWKLLAGARGPRASSRRAWTADLRSTATALLRVSLPALVAGVSLQPALWVGQVLLSRQPDGLAQVGAFAVALRWQAIALFVPSTMGSVLLPMLGRLRATGHHADARRLFLRYSGLTLAFSTTAGVLVAALAAPLMGLQGPEYVSAGPVLVVLAVAIVPNALNNVASQRAVAEGRLALWVWSDLALAVTLATAVIPLVPMFLGQGLAYAYLLGYFVTCAILLPVAWSARRLEVTQP